MANGVTSSPPWPLGLGYEEGGWRETDVDAPMHSQGRECLFVFMFILARMPFLDSRT